MGNAELMNRNIVETMSIIWVPELGGREDDGNNGLKAMPVVAPASMYLIYNYINIFLYRSIYIMR